MRKLLTMNQVKEILGLAHPTIYRLIRKGDLKAYKIGGSIRFKEEDIEELLSSGSILSNYVEEKGKT